MLREEERKGGGKEEGRMKGRKGEREKEMKNVFEVYIFI